MTEIITDEKLITKYQRQFVQQLKGVCDEKIKCNLGYQGESSDELTVFYSNKFNFWFMSQENTNRYWNAFGFGRAQQGRNNSITVEINIPYEGINRNIGGVFGVDKKSDVLVLHRGKIGGGRVGIGKQLFFDNYRDEPILANDDGIENDFCLIGGLSSKYLPQQVGNFVSEVYRVKNLTEEQVTDFSSLNNFSFTDEATGSKKIQRSGTTVIERTHGIVVNSLARILESKGYEIAKDTNRDLFIHNRGQIKKMFEIKRSSSTHSLYSAVGQLIIYSIPIKNAVDLILVLPDKLNKTVEKRLNELGMQALYYDWNNGEPVFNNLEKLL
jgi:hypothetical protein